MGVYPETKLSNYFAGLGLPLEGKLLQSVAAHGYCGFDAETDSFCAAARGAGGPGPILLQSFAPESLQALANATDLPRVQLANGNDSGKATVSPLSQLQKVATYAQAISIPTSWDADFFDETVALAQAETTLDVHAWVADGDPNLYTRLAGLGIVNAFTNDVPFGQGTLSESALCRKNATRG